MKEEIVYIYLNNAFVPAGRLIFDSQGRFSKAFFRYGDQYLQRKDAVSIDPVQLPLSDKEFETEPGFEIFNGIRDAGPDRWGRYLLDKKYARALDELDYITFLGRDRGGALGFADHAQGLVEPISKRLDLKLCVDAAEQALLGKNSPELEAFLNYGPSMGGARPKAAVTWNNKPYIAKFTVSMDKRNEALLEYATMSLANICGLNVPPIDKTYVSGRDIFLIERFDRKTDASGEHPIPFMSGLTATGFHEQDYEQWSYLSLCDAINRFSQDPVEDKNELFKRMIFNILVFNNDDHMRNHGFIYVGDQQWRLSPLYDVVPGEIHSDTYMLSMIVGNEGKEASIENALSSAGYFDISIPEAKRLVDMLSQQVHDWENHFRECGVSDQDINKLRHSFRS